MKYSILAIIVVLAGCATPSATTPTQATAPPTCPTTGYISCDDQSLAAILAGATQFYNSMHDQQAAGTFKPTSAEVTALNILQSSVAQAAPIYENYHNGLGTLTAAQNAIDKVSAAQTSAQNLITGGK